jgi:hypothetical protein
MLDYILSKLNMLILVTAIFAVATYFAFYLAQSLENQQADTVLKQVTQDAFGVLTSQSICHQVTLTLPQYINTLGRGNGGNKLYYLFQINQIDGIQPGPPPLNTIVFSIRDKRDRHLLSAQQLPTGAQIYLFTWTPSATGTQPVAIAQTDADGTRCGSAGQTCSVLNPQSAPVPANAVMVVKEVFEGHTNLLLIPCSTSGSWCEANFQSAVEYMKSIRPGGRFNCVPSS